MKPAGRIINFSKSGNIILRSEKAPGIGQLIVDKRSTTVGKVIRITGPVSKPYVILRPSKDDPGFFNSLLGKELYISDRPSRDAGKKDRRSRYKMSGNDRKPSRGDHFQKEKRPKKAKDDGSKKQYGRRIHRKNRK